MDSDDQFDQVALELFRFQADHVSIYSNYLKALNVAPADVKNVAEIPFLPIQFFKSHEVFVAGLEAELTFKSSGTTGQIRSQHHVHACSFYDEMSEKGFHSIIGNPSDYCWLCLLPGYLERGDSSLVHMCKHFTQISKHEASGFYLDDFEGLNQQIKLMEEQSMPTILIGVSFALLDFGAAYPQRLKHVQVMETGGMKGRKKEITRAELHAIFEQSFGTDNIMSEYGMTELLSQAYATSGGQFQTSPWMRVIIRDLRDPFSSARVGKSGGINVIDLANVHSCAFIATEDVGRLSDSNTFEVQGRIDHSEARGCNLMVSDLL